MANKRSRARARTPEKYSSNLLFGGNLRCFFSSSLLSLRREMEKKSICISATVWERSRCCGERCCLRLFRWPSARHQVYLQKPSISYCYHMFVISPAITISWKKFNTHRRQLIGRWLFFFWLLSNKCFQFVAFSSRLPPIVKFIWFFKYTFGHYLFAKFYLLPNLKPTTKTTKQISYKHINKSCHNDDEWTIKERKAKWT